MLCQVHGASNFLFTRMNLTARKTFSVARIEHTSVRVEQTLILNNVESQVKLRRLEGMIAQMLVETEFGQNVLKKTVEVISTDPIHESLEYRYLSMQTMRLIESIGNFSVDSGTSTDGRSSILKTTIDSSGSCNSLFTLRPTSVGAISPLGVLHSILGTVRDIHHGHDIPGDTVTYLMLYFEVHLYQLGMIPEVLAWELVKIQILRPRSDSGSLVELAVSLTYISMGYQCQKQHRSALEASQQSWDLWHHIHERLPNHFHPFHPLQALVIHGENLLQDGQYMTALSVAQEAVALSRSAMDGQMIGECDELAAMYSQKPLFMLATALSSLGRNLEAYEASKEAFQTALLLPWSLICFINRDIDCFIDQICSVAEGGGFSLAMLGECASLFHDLAGIYSDQFSLQFLRLLHAYVYHLRLNDSASLQNMRSFLEPAQGQPMPELDITSPGRFGVLDHTIEDALNSFYTYPSESWHLLKLIQNIFMTHFGRAMVVLREVLVKLSSDSDAIQWVLWSIEILVECIPKTNRRILLRPLSEVIKHHNTIIASRGSDWKWFLDSVTQPLHHKSWIAGLLAEALAGYEQAIIYLRSQADDPRAVWWFQLTQNFVLCDMGRLPDAIRMAQQTKVMPIPEEYEEWILHVYILETRILRRMGRHREALQIVKRGLANGCRKYWTDGDKAFDLGLNLLFGELAATLRNLGKPERALKAAERAVTACRKAVSDEDVDAQKCVLVHSLATHSDCLAAVGRDVEAHAVSCEAVLIYTQNAADTWDSFVYTIRNQELGANTFHSLSLRLATAGDLDQALIISEKATGLYRELASLVPRHLSTLANSLRNLASTLWKTDRREEAIAACEEAVGIMRKVVDPETYFLPSLAESLNQLASYLEEKGDVEGAFATTTESAEARGKFASLPPEPDFIFERISEVDSDDEYEADAEECQEIAKEVYSEQPEGDEEVRGESDGLGDVAAVAETDCAIPEPAAPAESERTTPDPVASAQSGFAKALRTPLAVRLRSTPMDILWWILIGVLFAVVFRRGI
ncbi:hypothetical protein C8R47DRAFT_93884 [Mycena vitilis]|nr:hypothetical protein C8R47DRAFT_93884 [Mycena vitilis]